MPAPAIRVGARYYTAWINIVNNGHKSPVFQRSITCIMGSMIDITVPGRGLMRLEHLVTDVNGTLALDGQLIDGVAPRLAALRDRLTIHLLTADTHGKQALIDQQLNLTAVRIQPGNEAEKKLEYINKLGVEKVVAIGQGANDSLMLVSAQIGICILSTEGAARESILGADLVMPDILSALDLFDKPLRLVASLRK